MPISNIDMAFTWFSVPIGWLVGLLIGLPLAFVFVQFVYLSCILVATEKETDGGGYYRLNPAGRDAFRRKLQFHRRLLTPILWLLRRSNRFSFDRLTFQYKGVAGPTGTCSEEKFREAAQYVPEPEDVFIVSQMKCGTTWTQQLVYEILVRGEGTLAETGTTLYAISPWIESTKTISPDETPVVGTESARRIIKTHLPVELCPRNDLARYIYITRDPVSCFASCRDFILSNLGERDAIGIPDSIFEQWFCSREKMWWTDWPNHVDGWWKASQEQSNVCMLRFEQLKADARSIVIELSKFLGIEPLSDSEIENVLRKSSFAYMKEHADLFEMYPPHLLQESAEMFVSGQTTRNRDVDAGLQSRIEDYCRSRCKEFPFETFYDSQSRSPGKSAHEKSP